MIIEKEINKNGRCFVERYSDKNVKIKRQDGTIFVKAVDPFEFKEARKYEETNIVIKDEKEQFEEYIAKAESLGFKVERELVALENS